MPLLRPTIRAAPWLAAAALAALVSTAGAQDADVERGLALAEAQCARCHAIDATGASRLPIAPPFRTLGERYPVDTLEESLAEGIVTGHPGMPEIAWEPDQIADFLAWLASIQQ